MNFTENLEGVLNIHYIIYIFTCILTKMLSSSSLYSCTIIGACCLTINLIKYNDYAITSHAK